MANHKSAKKRSIQSSNKYVYNTQYLTKIRTNLNKFKVSLQANNSEDIQNYLSQLNSAMSKAVKKGIIKKQQMSRKLSSLSKLIKNN